MSSVEYTAMAIYWQLWDWPNLSSWMTDRSRGSARQPCTALAYSSYHHTWTHLRARQCYMYVYDPYLHLVNYVVVVIMHTSAQLMLQHWIIPRIVKAVRVQPLYLGGEGLEPFKKIFRPHIFTPPQKKKNCRRMCAKNILDQTVCDNIYKKACENFPSLRR